jgi:hypothetical protein
MPPAAGKKKRTSAALTEDAAEQGLAQLVELDTARQAKRARCSPPHRNSDNDDEPSLSAVYDQFFAIGSDTIMRLTNFSHGEISRLWRRMESFVALNWNVGRGKKCSYGGKDVLFMLLTSLKHCGKWDIVASVFKVNPPTFQKMILKFASVVEPFLFEQFVSAVKDEWTMERLVQSGKTFTHHPAARYATDVTFQQSNVPYGLCEGRSIYFSGKHKLHGYKVEVSVLPTGQAINCTKHFPGRESDIEIFRHNEAFHVQCLAKSDREETIEDAGVMTDRYPNEWAVLVDKGYQGLCSHFRAISPNKKRHGEILSIRQMHENDDIAHDRVIVENYFGRLCSLWAVCSDKYRWAEDKYDMFFRLCVSLTNVHARLNPLRAEDGEAYEKYLARLTLIGEEMQTKRADGQRRYRERRQQRLRTMFRARRESSDHASFEASDSDSLEETCL